MAARWFRVCAAWVLALLLASTGAQAQRSGTAAAAESLALDLYEQVLQLPVKATDRFGREVQGSITVTSYHPPGVGPFPLVIMNHGRGPAERRARQGRSRFEPLSRYLVSRGFAVLIPTRLGYAETSSLGDPEDPGTCRAPQREVMAEAATQQVLATLALARSLPWIDASRWVVMGQSVGGLTSVAVASRNPPGLVAAVNFAGGAGGRPDDAPGEPCAPDRLAALWAQQAATARVPMLWIYWLNDRYWGADKPREWLEAWQRGGGQAELHQLPGVGRDGHVGYGVDMDHWMPLVDAYLARRGFALQGQQARPEASHFAELADVERLPAGPSARELYTRRFLSAPRPRAFALGPDGSSGWATGDWASGRALGFCQRRTGVRCKLYALDDEVVWQP